MVKISRPAVYTFVAAVAVYAGVLLTQPDAPAPPARKSHLMKHAKADPDAAVTSDDLNASFARYGGSKRNPFQSALLAGDAGDGLGGTAGTGRGEWTLTGINILNGIPSALVENGATGETVFLHTGDHWRGLHVVSINPGSVSFLNALGQRTQLAFRSLDTPAPVPGTPGPGGYHLLPLPVGPSNIQPLPPLGSMPAPKGR